MKLSQLHHHIVTRLPKEDSQERVKEYIQSCTNSFENQRKRRRKSLSRDVDSDDYNKEDINSLVVSISKSSSDLLDGRRAIEKRLKERRDRRKQLARMRKSPLAVSYSDDNSSHYHHKECRKKSKPSYLQDQRGKHSYVQDRSHSKASRLRKEAIEKRRREKEKEKKGRKTHNFLDLLGLNRPTMLSKERFTMPQPKNKIFSRGTASPHFVQGPSKKRKHREMNSTPSEHSSNSSGKCSTNLNRVKDERIAILEDQLNDLRKTVEQLQELKEKKSDMQEEIDLNNQIQVIKAPNDRAPPNEIQVLEDDPTRNASIVAIDVGHLPWSKPMEEVKQYEEEEERESTNIVPVLAFNGDKPVSHPNGWRAQHHLHNGGIHAIRQKYKDDGGARFQVSSPKVKANKPIIRFSSPTMRISSPKLDVSIEQEEATNGLPELALFRHDHTIPENEEDDPHWYNSKEFEEELQYDTDAISQWYETQHSKYSDTLHNEIDHQLSYFEEDDIETIYETENEFKEDYGEQTIGGLNEEDLQGFWRPLF